MLNISELKMNIIAIGFQLLLIAAAVTTLPTDHVEVTRKEIDYLTRLGYYKEPPSEISSMHSEKKIRDSLENLQRFAGLTVSGILDEPTKELIETPRCGMPDITKAEDKRKRRFTLQGSKWRKNELTWKLLNNNNDGLSREAVEATLQKAFSMWEAVTNLKFIKLSLNSNKISDIDVKFLEDYHNDPYAFDGVGGTLAHAFYPHNNEGLSGDVHFDDAEQYTIDSPNGRSLLWVAVHEIGHSIGLEHSNVKEALMFPWYNGNKGNNFQLTEDDVFGIQSLYGSKEAKSHQIKAAIYEQSTGITYAFNKDKFYKISEDLKKTEGPFLVSERFSNIGSVDTGFMNSENKLIFFSGTRYYMYESFSNRKLLETGSIFNKYKGISKNIKKIDAAFVWSNGKTYIFTGDEYYRFDGTNNHLNKSFPRKISENWVGIPANLDSVFVWKNGATYFFKGSKFYRVNLSGHLLKDYPKNISGIWLNSRKK